MPSLVESRTNCSNSLSLTMITQIIRANGHFSLFCTHSAATVMPGYYPSHPQGQLVNRSLFATLLPPRRPIIIHILLKEVHI